MTKGRDEVILLLGWAGGCSAERLERKAAATALDHHRRHLHASPASGLQ